MEVISETSSCSSQLIRSTSNTYDLRVKIKIHKNDLSLGPINGNKRISNTDDYIN